MGRKRLKLTSLAVITSLATIGLASCTTSEKSASGSISGVDDTVSFNSTEATGLAPVVTLNTFDTSKLTTSESADVTEVSSDTTLEGYHYNGVNITTAKNGEITLTLNNATIYQNSDEGKALWNSNKGVTVNLVIPEGTTSYIYNNYEDVNAIHIKGLLNISGGGTLVVSSGQKAAIKCSSIVTVTDTTVELEAATYGISAESVDVTEANIDVLYAGKDGIRAEVENEEVETAPTFDSSIGYVSLTNTAYNAVVEGDGIQANTTLTISGGTTNISTQGTWVAYSSANIEEYELNDDDFKWSPSGSTYKKIDSDTIGTNYSKYYALVQSCKGLKVGALKYTLSTDTTTELEVSSTSYNLTITDGAVVNLTTSDSGSKVDYGDTIISGGSTVNVNTGNKGFAPEHDFYLEGSETSLTVTNSYEAVEAAHLYFNNGTAILSASDDGVNAASDYDTDDYDDIKLVVNDGLLSVNANGDGLDSNGAIYFVGGTTLVLGPESGSNQAIDADNKVYFNGGSVFAVGTSGMATTSNYTSQTSNYVLDFTTSSTSSSTQITVTDSDGNVLVSVTISQSFGEFIFSSSLLSYGSTYTVEIGSNSTTVTISSTVTTGSRTTTKIGR